MVKTHFSNPKFIIPPGCQVELLAHPYFNRERTIELSIFFDHRFAFFFWAKWTNEFRYSKKIMQPPSLISFDWHQDLTRPTEAQKEWLQQLDTSNNEELALYSWANLSHINDEQIMAAVYLNLIGNVYIHCRQGKFESHWEDLEYEDLYGNKHLIKKFKQSDDLQSFLIQSSEELIYLDIDLDFMTVNNPLNGVGKEYTYLDNETIHRIFDNTTPLMKWIFQKMAGFTIATEPEHTGGLLKSNRYLDIINEVFFDPPLFSNYGSDFNKGAQWKHLTDKTL